MSDIYYRNLPDPGLVIDYIKGNTNEGALLVPQGSLSLDPVRYGPQFDNYDNPGDDTATFGKMNPPAYTPGLIPTPDPILGSGPDFLNGGAGLDWTTNGYAPLAAAGAGIGLGTILLIMAMSSRGKDNSNLLMMLLLMGGLK